MEDSDELPPYWQPPATIAWRQRRRGSSPLLNSSLMIILLPSLLLFFTVFIVVHCIPRILPHFHSKPTISNNSPDPIQKSISLNKSWDFLNIILVLFAILCGIFAKRHDHLPSSSSSSAEHDQNPPHIHTAATSSSTSDLLQKSKSVTNHHHHHQSSSAPQWFEHYSQNQRISPPLNASPVTNRLRRTVSSDPYLRDTGNSQFRFFDDLDVTRFYPHEQDSQPQPSESVQVDDVVKDIPVDTFVLHKTREEPLSPPQTPPHNPTTPPPPPPPPAKQRRTFQTLPRRERAPPTPPPPPPPRGREGKKRSGRKSTTKDIATAIVSLYSHKKRKRRLKSSRNDEEPQPSQTQSQMAPPPSPPPPPPPPPPSVFHNLFKKTKKIHSLSSTPTPHPPPSRRNKSAGKPPLPTRESRNKPPVNGIPAAPPHPPMKLAVGEEYVRVGRPQCGSAEMDGGDESGSEMKGKDGRRERMTCPSPDVNLKADTFIARHHDGWRLEKLNSWREKHNHNKAGSGEW